MEYKVIIVGSGPAGIFAGLVLAELGVAPVLLLEQGKPLRKRQRTDMLCGWGGAGAFSDGKLTNSPEVGGFLADFLDKESLQRLLTETEDIWIRHGAPERVFGGMSPAIQELSDRARLADLDLIPARIRHIGTEHCMNVLEGLRQSLEGDVAIRTQSRVNHLVAERGKITGVVLEGGERLHAPFVIVAPGRSGASWMKEEATRLGLRTQASPVDIGVRVELPAPVLKGITDVTYESKLIYYSKTFDDKVRTFCMNPYGEVVIEKNGDIITVNGHSYANRMSLNTNFAVLVSSSFTEPFDDPIAYGLYIARLANLLGKGPIVQRLGDLLAGRRSTRERIDRCLTRPTLKEATPGDLSFVFPYRHLRSIIEMLQAIEKMVPGVYSRNTLLYGVEVKLYCNRIRVSSGMETEVANLFAIGDGAGITRGLLQASASGIMAGRAIAGRVKG
jgi:uncharacterized FAD-dependent dehydrogenase